MKTYSNNNENGNYIWKFVNTRRNKAEAMAQPFETHTLHAFAKFVKELTTIEAELTNGQEARWSKVTAHTLEKYIEDSLRRGKSLFKLEQEVQVIDEFLKWTYRSEKKRYTQVCKAAIEITYKLAWENKGD